MQSAAAAETVSVSEVPLPEPGPGEVVLETLACGVCGSDLRYYVGDNPWSQHTLGRQEPVDWDRTILGHEVCARVAALGPKVTTDDGKVLWSRILNWDHTCPIDSLGCAAYIPVELALQRAIFDDELGPLARRGALDRGAD